MTAQCYSFKVGNFECSVLLDGVSVIGRAGVLKRFPDASEADYDRVVTAMGVSLDDAVSSFNLLAIKTNEGVILVDTGEGGRPKGGSLLASLKLAGITPEAVTQIIISHADGDHIYGLLSADHEPVFPNAAYVIARDERVFWQQRIADSTPAQQPFLTLMETRGLRLIERDAAILPGISAIMLPGHTPGHTGVLVESEGAKLFYLADVIHQPMQFAHPEWSPTYDVDTTRSVPTRRAALGRVADEAMLALFYHLPFPGLGHIQRAPDGKGFLWQPLPGQS